MSLSKSAQLNAFTPFEPLFNALVDPIFFSREELALGMPTLECRLSSSEEDLLTGTDDELDGKPDSAENKRASSVPSSAGYEEYAVTFDLPGTLLTPVQSLLLLCSCYAVQICSGITQMVELSARGILCTSR